METFETAAHENRIIRKQHIPKTCRRPRDIMQISAGMFVFNINDICLLCIDIQYICLHIYRDVDRWMDGRTDRQTDRCTLLIRCKLVLTCDYRADRLPHWKQVLCLKGSGTTFLP